MSWTRLLEESIKSKKFEHASNLLQRMQENQVLPDRHSFLALVKSCIELKCLEKSRVIHSEIVKRGLEKDHIVGGTLLDMYVKLGSLGEAIAIFDKVEAHDVISWTTLITGYAENGSTEETLDCLRRMELEGVFPNAVTYICSLKGCVNAESGFKLHAEVVTDGYEIHLLVGTTLVDMYAKCGWLAEAQEVFDELKVRNIVTWNALVTGYAKLEFGERVLENVEKMEAAGVSPSALTYICGLKGCGSVQALDEGQRMYSVTVKKGFERDYKVVSALVNMYGKCGSYLEANSVFNQVSTHDTVLWNALLAGYIGNGLGEKALELLMQMDSEGVPANIDTLTHSLKACGSIQILNEGHKLHTRAVKKGCDLKPLVCYSLIDMYMNCGSPTDAQKVFDELPVKDAISWTALMVGYTELGFAERALTCLGELQAENIPFDNVSLLCGLKACCITGNLNRGKELHVRIAEEGYEKDLHICNSLVDMYARCGLLLDAQGVICEIPFQDVGSWSAFISACAELGYYEEALMALQEMQLVGISMNLTICICCLKCYGMIGDFKRGKVILIEALKKGLDNDPFVANSAIDMYVKFGSLLEAECIASKGKVQDVVPWNAMIAGYVEHGLGTEARNCIERVCVGLSPNAVTYLSGLKVCGSMGDLDYGRMLHADTVKKGVLNHYQLESAIVDMYVKCNCFVEALKVFDSMPIHDVVSWTALITGYAAHGSVEEASHCVKQMLAEGVYPNDVTYISILKACSSIRDRNWGLAIHAEIVRDGFEEDSFVSATLVDMYAKCGLLVEARELLLELKVVDSTSWTALIAGYAEHGLAKESLSFLQQMEDVGAHASSVTYICSLKACGSTAALHTGRELHGKIVSKGLECDPLIGSSIMDMYAKCGHLQEAWRVFEGLQEQDVVSWNSLLTGCACQGESQSVFLLLEKMKEVDTEPDKSTLLSVLFVCSHVGLAKEGYELTRSANEAFGVTLEHLNCLLDLLNRSGQFHEAWVLVERMPFQPELVTWSTLLCACQKWDNSGKVARHSFEYAVKLGRKHVLAFQQIFRTSCMEEFRIGLAKNT